MAVCRIEEDVELKATAKKFFHMWCSAAHKLPNVTDHIQAVELHEDHQDHEWDLNGAKKKWNYTIDGREESFEERLEFDEQGLTIKIVGLKGDAFKSYKVFNIYFNIDPKDTGCVVKVIIEYEKLNDDVPDPQNYLALAITVAKDICAHHSKTN